MPAASQGAVGLRAWTTRARAYKRASWAGRSSDASMTRVQAASGFRRAQTHAVQRTDVRARASAGRTSTRWLVASQGPNNKRRLSAGRPAGLSRSMRHSAAHANRTSAPGARAPRPPEGPWHRRRLAGANAGRSFGHSGRKPRDCRSCSGADAAQLAPSRAVITLIACTRLAVSQGLFACAPSRWPSARS